MNYQKFNNSYKTLHDRVEDLLITKAEEYAEPDGDRLFNFKQAVSLLNTNQAEVAFAYCTKHYASLAKIVQDIDKGKLPNEALILEKCGDIIAYTYLIYACLLEQSTLLPKEIG